VVGDVLDFGNETGKVINECIANLPDIVQGKNLVFFSEVNELGLTFSVKLLINNLSQASAIKSQVLVSIRRAFVEHEISFLKSINTFFNDRTSKI